MPQGGANDGLVSKCSRPSNDSAQDRCIQPRLALQAQLPFTLIQHHNGRRYIQSPGDADYYLIEDGRKVHLGGQRTGDILKSLALPILYLYTTTHLRTLNCCCQDTHHPSYEALQSLIRIGIGHSTAKFK